MKNDHKIFTKQGYVLKKDKLTEDKIEQIKKDLTMTPKVNTNYCEKPDSYELFKESNGNITVPKFYGINNFEKYKNRPKVDKININFKGELRSHQKPIVSSCYKDIIKKGGGIISIGCGAGKTVLAINLATKLKVKTLVIVHKTFLQNQWVERIQQFTDAKIGTIRQKKIDIEGKDIVVGMLQSISMIDYDQSIFEPFGLVIYDECHHCPAKVFSKALQKTGTKYTLGLSATPNRKDGMTPIMNHYLGEIIYKLEKAGDNRVMVKIFNYVSTDKKLFAEKKSWFNGKVVKSIPKMITNICKIKDRNNFIVDILNIIKNNPERKTLVISDRLDHLDVLKNTFDNIVAQLEKDGELDIGEVTTSKYIGGMREATLNMATEADIIFATYGMAEEGLDIDGLNTVILATPKTDIIQTIGRIMRKPIEEGDIVPLIIDIVDHFSSFPSWGNKRRMYYEKKDYNISFYEVFNDKCISIKKYMSITKEPKTNIELLQKYLAKRYDEYYYEMLEDDYDIDKIAEQITYEPDLNIIFNEQNNQIIEDIQNSDEIFDDSGDQDDILLKAKLLRQK